MPAKLYEDPRRQRHARDAEGQADGVGGQIEQPEVAVGDEGLHDLDVGGEVGAYRGDTLLRVKRRGPEGGTSWQAFRSTGTRCTFAMPPTS